VTGDLRVRVILLLTVAVTQSASQSILASSPHFSGLMAIYLLRKILLFFGSVYRGASSLTGGRVCHVMCNSPCLCRICNLCVCVRLRARVCVYIYKGKVVPVLN
jgi:hypothetical protein